MVLHLRGNARGNANPLLTTITRRVPRFALTTKLAAFGSSSSAGLQNQQNNGIVTNSLLGTSALCFQNTPTAAAYTSFAIGGASATSTLVQMDTAVSGGYNNATIITQCDLQASDFTIPGGGHVQAMWYRNSGLPKFDSTVASERRHHPWVGSFGSEQVWGSGQWFNSCRFERLLWAEYPGLALNALRYYQWIPPAGTDEDVADKTSVAVTSTGPIPRSYQIADRSHARNKGLVWQSENLWLNLIEAQNGGMPFFADHYYLSTASTAQTNSGYVIDLEYVGSLTGWTLSLKNPDGSTNVDFVIDLSSAPRVKINRAASATFLKRPYDIFLECRRGDDARTYHLELAIGALTTVPQLCYFDGNVGATVWTNDNAGTLTSPSFPSTTQLTWANLSSAANGGTSQTEGSFVYCLLPDADRDAVIMYLDYMQGSLIMQRNAAGKIDIIVRDDTSTTIGGSFGSMTSTPTVRNADGLNWVFYSFSCANNRQRLIVMDDATGTLRYNVTTTVSAKTTAALNQLCNPGGTGRQLLMLGGTSSGYQNTYKGYLGPRWKAPLEIDFTVSGNRSLFRSGVGVFADLGSTGAVVPVSGANSGSTVTPYEYWNGNAADFVGGRNLGVGGNWEAWQKRDFNLQNWLQGVPFNT